MKRNAHAALGALHPVLFFVVLYSIALFLALFVCRTVFYSINSKDDTAAVKVVSHPLNNAANSSNMLTAAVYK